MSVAALVMSGVMLAGLVFAPAQLQGLLRSLPRVVGKVATVTVLTTLYVLVFWPLGLVVRGGASARFRRGYSASAETYWKTRTSESSPERPF